MKQLGAYRTQLQADLDVINNTQDMSARLTSQYQQGSAQQRQLIASALGNLAIGVFRNVKLADQAPGMVSAASGNPQLLTRIGEFKAAAALLAIQGKGLTSIGATLPKLMGAMKLKTPAAAESTKPEPYNFS
jgi:hypothetical protein